MYYAPLDTPCIPKTWDISDEYVSHLSTCLLLSLQT
jgi:hypothetical protein